MNELPWVLLVIRTAPKEDLGTSSAVGIYVLHLTFTFYLWPRTVPRDFIATPSCSEAPKILLPALHDNVQRFMPTLTTRQGNKSSSIPLEVRSSLFVKGTAIDLPKLGHSRCCNQAPKSSLTEVGNQKPCQTETCPSEIWVLHSLLWTIFKTGCFHSKQIFQMCTVDLRADRCIFTSFSAQNTLADVCFSKHWAAHLTSGSISTDTLFQNSMAILLK